MPIKSVRIKLNRAGVQQLLTSQVVTDDLTKRGERMAAAAGEGVEATTTRNRDRTVVFVRTETFDAMRAEAEDRTLTRAIDAGR